MYFTKKTDILGATSAINFIVGLVIYIDNTNLLKGYQSSDYHIFYRTVYTTQTSQIVTPWNKMNTISFPVSKISLIFLMTPMDSTNEQYICAELLKATYMQ